MLQGIGIIELGERSARKFFEHRMTTYAAALAYRGLFGLFPFILILVFLVGALGLRDFIDRTFEQAEQRVAGELLLFGVGVALWSTSALARTSTEAFNAAYETAETRPGWKRSALSWAFGPVLAFIAIFAVGLMLVGPRLVERLAEVFRLDELFVFLWGWLRFPVAFSLLAVVLSLVYRYGPDARQRFRTVGLGAALAVLLWAISSVGFSFYLASFADYGVTYGSLGAAVGLLFYLNLSAAVVLLGAEVNAAVYQAVSRSMKVVELPGNLDNEATNTGRLKDV